MGSPEDFKNFVTAVIHKDAYDRLVKVIEKIKIDTVLKLL